MEPVSLRKQGVFVCRYKRVTYDAMAGEKVRVLQKTVAEASEVSPFDCFLSSLMCWTHIWQLQVESPHRLVTNTLRKCLPTSPHHDTAISSSVCIPQSYLTRKDHEKKSHSNYFACSLMRRIDFWRLEGVGTCQFAETRGVRMPI